ncbi:hypothetical protein FRC12_019021 [Ceratobasidium sp. 428]|nr:hypothetical protein FRC12_019021 [Ceratobasidium sp. 428]
MHVQTGPGAAGLSATLKARPKPLNMVWEELSDADFPARPPSAPSNIETISLWGPRYPGQKLHAEPETPMTPISEDAASSVPFEPDHIEIWDCVAGLCSALRSLIGALPDYDQNLSELHPHGPISPASLQKVGELYIESLEPLRPLRPGKLTDHALKATPELTIHVRELEHRFDDLERVLSLVPVVFAELTHDDCRAVMNKVETIMMILGVGLEEY